MVVQLLHKFTTFNYILKFITIFTTKPSLHSPLTLSNPIFLPPAYSPALIYFGRERSWWVTWNYPTVLKEKNRKKTERVQPALSVG
jgi:hypothetical protein